MITWFYSRAAGAAPWRALAPAATLLRNDVELPSRKCGLGASENNCVFTLLVLRACGAMIFHQKECWMSWVRAFQPLVCAPIGNYELNSNFPKFHFWLIEELSEFELLGGEPVQESSFENSIFKIALYNVWSTFGRGQNILGGPKVLFKGQKSVTLFIFFKRA